MGHINYIIFNLWYYRWYRTRILFLYRQFTIHISERNNIIRTVEPVVAVIASSLWLHVAFKPFQIVGIILIMILILLLSLKRQPETLDE